MFIYTLNQYFKEKFGEKVYKISIDAGLTCPNRDGTKGEGGCIYCDNSSFVFTDGSSIKDQISKGIERLTKKGVNRFIVYFQSYSNTYCNDEYFVDMIKESLIDDRIVGIFIGTRPDVINEKKLQFLSQLTNRYDIFMEYGLQSSHDKTLKFINRGHSVEDFEKAVLLTKSFGIKITTHLILGLPYETKSEMIYSVKYLAGLGVDAVKFHHLHIVKGTKLAELYLKNQLEGFKLLTEDEYIELLADGISYLKKDTIIARLVGDAPKELLIAPDWPKNKSDFTNKFYTYLKKHNIFQGKQYS
ncbi:MULTISPECIES: TIGR01212 family radical SAM protein [Calditerrivibrio]|uniref:TIGR01212 family radical SAM protein n=1 Tax=Calditerrivibrio nitroreducens TaxID=477976 RepID=A0A2J6WPR2_9BACT|nr:MAG: TIGR01212 family radical SAM protein [Calditerrivibrio nitroreducens]